MFDQQTIEALAILRQLAKGTPTGSLRWAVDRLDNAGVFAAIDEQTDSPRAERILEESGLAAHDHAFWGYTGPEEICSGSGDCTWTLGEYTRNQACTCGRPEERSPSLHAGTCPVWAVHHGISGDVVDFSGSVFNGPFVGKVVHRND